MAHNTKIPYARKGLPYPIGCTHADRSCENCWAEGLCATRLKHVPQYAGLTKKGKWTGEVRCDGKLLNVPYTWRKPQLVFVSTMGDPFHENVTSAQLGDMVWMMYRTPRHIYAVFTKRPHLLLPRLTERGYNPLPNVVIVASAHDQQTTDRACDYLSELAEHGWRVGLSLEPLLGPVDLKWRLDTPERWCEWVAVGCESGPNRRLCETQWVADILQQCQEAEVRCWVKQLQPGAAKPGKVPRVSHNPLEWPEALRVQQPVRGWTYRDGKLTPEE